MSRLIKFDAIYKPTGEHFIPTTLDFNQNVVTGDFDGEIKDWCYFSLDGKYGDVILRQFTGLTDKNGVEIYEGDIIEITTFSYHEPLNMVITTASYSENRASFVFSETQPQLCYRSLDEIVDDEYTFQTLVIGNIYESERESK